MANVTRLRKGLDIHLKGQARRQTVRMGVGGEYALQPASFVGVIPQVVVREGDHVKAGEPLFINKQQPLVRFASPVSGEVVAVERGERRRVLAVRVKADSEQQWAEYGKKDPAALSGEQVRQALLEAGLFGYINQLPYAVSTTPDTAPRAIFVSALRDMPLAGDFEYELEGNEAAWQAGLTALSRMAETHLGIGRGQKAKALLKAKDVETHVFQGPCPAGNVGVQVNHIAPVSKGEVVWTVEPTAVIFIGRLMLTGRVDLTRRVAVAGSMVTVPAYVETLVGAPLASVVEGNLVRADHIRLIDGNPLTGRVAGLAGWLGAHTSEVCVIPEGDNVNEVLGWIMPRFRQFSLSRSYFSWLCPKKEYDLDARVKGGERHMIMSGEYDRVLPMDIYAEYLIKAIITGDIDRQEQLGIYEVSPEDFAVAEFVDSSKLELQRIVRQGLDTLRKENA